MTAGAGCVCSAPRIDAVMNSCATLFDFGLTCPRRCKTNPLGVRIKTWTGLCRKSKTLSIFDGAERAKGELDPLLVVPVDSVQPRAGLFFSGGV